MTNQKMIYKLLKNDKKIILFDGICNLCNSSVLTIIKYDKKDAFLFASLQSETGKQITDHFKIDTAKVDSIILVESETAYALKSTAALKISKNFNGLWTLFQLFWIIPSFLRDSVYNYIAKNRYRWFGKKDTCMLPTQKNKSKFI
jgi:predicted DCC family thiol-disulfide oxidoreductase YuxK